jgi:HK97 family phage major capsid protein
MASATNAKALAAELREKRQAIQAEFDRYKSADGYDIPADQVESFRKRNEELNDLGKKWESAVEVERIADENAKQLARMDEVARLPFASKGGHAGHAAAERKGEFKSLGERFVDVAYKRERDGSIAMLGDRPALRKGDEFVIPGVDLAEFKTTMTTAAGFAPENFRSGRVVLSAQRPLTMLDVVPTLRVGVGNSAYVYMDESTFTNNAAEISENDGTGAAESALAYTERSKTIQRVATFLPVTDEQLDDVVGMQSLVNSRLTYMVGLRLDSQILNGNGSTPNIDGFYNQVTQAQAKGADPVFDAIFKGMIKVMHTGFANPSAVVLHPNDWQDMRLTKTVDGVYILQNPGDVAAERLFGLPVVVTPAASENTGLVGDFSMYSALVYRDGMEVKISDSHSDYFIKYKNAIRASVRAALVVFRISAFCEVTGI